MQIDQLKPPGEDMSDVVIEPGYTFGTITDKISSIVLTRRAPRSWWLGFGLAFILVMVMMYSITMLLVVGVGVWGINVPVAWGFAIINFVWWIGIGHAGTLISAILLLLRQEWRTSINRFDGPVGAHYRRGLSEFGAVRLTVCLDHRRAQSLADRALLHAPSLQ